MPRSPALGVLTTLILACLCLPTQAATPRPGDTTLGGQIFLDITHLQQTTQGRRTSSTGADLKRLFLNLDHQFSLVWSAHVTGDINWLRDAAPTDPWLRHAYIQGAFSKALVLQLGVADLPWAGLVNSWSGYRYVDNELVTRLNFGASSDWGVHVLGTVGDRGQLQYAASMISGSSYKRPRTGDRPDFETRVAWQPTAHTVLAIGTYDGTLAQDGGAHVAQHTARRWDAMAAWRDARFRLGAQYFRADNWNQVRTIAGDHASGWSAWASMQVAPRWTLFARHDQADTSARLDPARQARYSHLGLEYHVSRSVQVAAVVRRQRLANHTTLSTTTNEAGLWTQIAF